MHTIEHGLGRRHAPDERDRRFMLTRPEASGIEWRYWIAGEGTPYDQGRTSQCVAYSWVHWATANPVRNKPLPFQEIYDYAQRNDEWSGESYDGTSVRGGAKALQARGLITEYRWAFDLETMLAHLLTTGPVVVGVNWYGGMFRPDEAGLITPTGGIAGGHAIMAIGANRRTGRVRLLNSWGPDWGQTGRCWITFEHMAQLVAEDGEVCTATEKRV